MVRELGPVGVPKLGSSVLWFCTFGPGAPTSFTISGANTAARISRTMNTSETIATLSLRNRRQNSSIGERAVTPAPSG